MGSELSLSLPVQKKHGQSMRFVTAKVRNKREGALLCTISSNPAKHFIKWYWGSLLVWGKIGEILGRGLCWGVFNTKATADSVDFLRWSSQSDRVWGEKEHSGFLPSWSFLTICYEYLGDGTPGSWTLHVSSYGPCVLKLGASTLLLSF